MNQYSSKSEIYDKLSGTFINFVGRFFKDLWDILSFSILESVMNMVDSFIVFESHSFCCCDYWTIMFKGTGFYVFLFKPWQLLGRRQITDPNPKICIWTDYLISMVIFLHEFR